MDRNYCVIRLTDKINISIYLFYIKNSVINYPVCITGNKSEIIYYLITLHHYFNFLSMDHSLYLGKEIYKAELALIFDQEYIQN